MSVELGLALIGALVVVLGFVFRFSVNQNSHRDRIHARIDKGSDKSERRTKELEEKIHADRLRIAEDYVSHVHLEKHVMRSMEKGFAEIKALFNKVNK